MKSGWKILFYSLGIIILIVAVCASVFFYYVYFDKPAQGELVSGNSNYNASKDPYVKPNFDLVRQTLLQQEMIKDLPSDGSISLAFVHIFENYNVYDKIYLISKNKVEEKNAKGDVDIAIHTDYALRFSEGICNIIKEARYSGNLKEVSNLNMAQLAWKYSGMMKYRDCFGI